ncbi:MAG: hypothetical protein M3405_13070 [Acidobacteriota bacterium]|jgi:hypothetical protein|nr:hypothetical protein [Acidobacteriota bacterium]
MTNKQNDKTTNEESESRNIYDEIRAEIRRKQAQIPPQDAESVLTALSGQQAKNAEVLATLSGQQPTIAKGENNDEIK